MGLIDTLRAFDPEKQALTHDFHVVSKGQVAGRKVVPEKDAKALKEHVLNASAQEKDLIESAFNGNLSSIKHLEAQSPLIANIFNAAVGPPPPPDYLSDALPSISEAFGTQIAQIPNLTMNHLPSIIEGLVLEMLISKEPIPEQRLAKIAHLAEHHLEWFTKVNKALLSHIIKTAAVLASGSIEQLAQGQSTSGVYFGSIGGKKEVVIKPRLEEYKAPYNPHVDGIHLVGLRKIEAVGPEKTPIRLGYLSGDGSRREAEAYATDFVDDCFANTPPTLFVSITHRDPMVNEGGDKECSIQAFIEGDIARARDFPKLSKSSLESLAYADIDEGNADRHLGGNLLVAPDGHVRRIDQALTRGTSSDQCVFDWMELPQLSRPMGQKTLKKIAQQDLAVRLGVLQEFGLEMGAIELERERILLKKNAAAKGLTFFDIGAILTTYLGSDQNTVCEFTNMLERSKKSSWQAETQQVLGVVLTEKQKIYKLFYQDQAQAKALASHGPLYLQKILTRQIELLEKAHKHLQVMGGKAGLSEREIAFLEKQGSIIDQILSDREISSTEKAIGQVIADVAKNKVMLREALIESSSKHIPLEPPYMNALLTPYREKIATDVQQLQAALPSYIFALVKPRIDNQSVENILLEVEGVNRYLSRQFSRDQKEAWSLATANKDPIHRKLMIATLIELSAHQKGLVLSNLPAIMESAKEIFNASANTLPEAVDALIKVFIRGNK